MGVCCSARKYDIDSKFLIYRQRHAVNQDDKNSYLDGQQENIINYEEYQHRFCNRNNTHTYLSLIQEDFLKILNSENNEKSAKEFHDPQILKCYRDTDSKSCTNLSENNRNDNQNEVLNTSKENGPEIAILPKRLNQKYYNNINGSASDYKSRSSSHKNIIQFNNQSLTQVKRKSSNPYMKVIHDDTGEQGKPKVEYIRTSLNCSVKEGHVGS